MADARDIIVAAMLRNSSAGKSYESTASQVIEDLEAAGWEVRRSDQSQLSINIIRARWEAWTRGEAA